MNFHDILRKLENVGKSNVNDVGGMQPWRRYGLTECFLVHLVSVVQQNLFWHSCSWNFLHTSQRMTQKELLTSLCYARPLSSNPQAAVAAVDRRDRQTDGETDIRPLCRHAMPATLIQSKCNDSVNCNRQLSSSVEPAVLWIFTMV